VRSITLAAPRQNPQFAIRYAKKEVNPPTKKQIEKVLATATGRVKLLAQLMRETAMALVDAQKFDPATLEDKTLIRNNRHKTHERFRVRISSSLAKQLEALEEIRERPQLSIDILAGVESHSTPLLIHRRSPEELS
jgi:hypothetical protein